MAFMFKLEREDGTPADPPTLKAAVPDWRAGDTIALGHGRLLRVVATRLDEGLDGEPVSGLVVDPGYLLVLLQAGRRDEHPDRRSVSIALNRER
jgi:hypothetical protein